MVKRVCQGHDICIGFRMLSRGEASARQSPASLSKKSVIPPDLSILGNTDIVVVDPSAAGPPVLFHFVQQNPDRPVRSLVYHQFQPGTENFRVRRQLDVAPALKRPKQLMFPVTRRIPEVRPSQAHMHLCRLVPSPGKSAIHKAAQVVIFQTSIVGSVYVNGTMRSGGTGYGFLTEG